MTLGEILFARKTLLHCPRPGSLQAPVPRGWPRRVTLSHVQSLFKVGVSKVQRALKG